MSDEPSDLDASLVFTAVRNEFAVVELAIVATGHRQGLAVRLPESGKTILLDPLELESLTHAGHPAFATTIGALAGDAPDASSQIRQRRVGKAQQL